MGCAVGKPLLRGGGNLKGSKLNQDEDENVYRAREGEVGTLKEAYGLPKEGKS